MHLWSFFVKSWGNIFVLAFKPSEAKEVRFSPS